MIIIGITGSIGMGKTTISSMLRFLNIPIFDSDKEVKKVLIFSYPGKKLLNLGRMNYITKI